MPYYVEFQTVVSPELEVNRLLAPLGSPLAPLPPAEKLITSFDFTTVENYERYCFEDLEGLEPFIPAGYRVINNPSFTRFLFDRPVSVYTLPILWEKLVVGLSVGREDHDSEITISLPLNCSDALLQETVAVQLGLDESAFVIRSVTLL